MTAQDWMTGLEEDEETPGTASTHLRRWLVTGAVAAVVVLALAALAAVLLGQERTPRSAATAPADAAASSADVAASAVVAPEVGPVLIQAALDYPGLIDNVVPTAPLVVGTEPVQGGAAPDRVPNFGSCSGDPASLQYLPVQIREPEDWLSASFTVEPTASTPTDIGRLGFYFQAGEASIPCRNGAWSTSDSFQASNTGQAVITGYVVLDRAFTPTTPQGRADVFPTLRLRISNIRLSGRPAEVHPPTIGSFCPGAQRDLCASLG